MNNQFRNLWNKYFLKIKKQYMKHFNNANFFTDKKKFIGLAIIGLALVYIFMPKFISLVKCENDFYKFVRIISLITCVMLIGVSLYLNFVVCYENFNLDAICKDIKKISTNLKIEIKGLTFNHKFLFFGLVFFIIITFIFLMIFNYIKLAFMFLFFGTFYIIKDFSVIKSLNNQMFLDDSKISEKYKKNYKFIYYFSKFIKIIFYIYVPYFFIWCFVGKSYILIEYIVDWENSQIMLEQLMREFSQSGKHLYVLYCLFLNSLLLDYLMESLVIYLDFPDQVLVVNLLRSLGKRVFHAAALATGGGVAVGGVVVYSPLVEIPGVNEFQIRYGRGHGYRTTLDYCTAMVYQRYLPKELMDNFIKLHIKEDKILDGIFFRLLAEDKDVVQIMNKNATINELRFLGLRRF